MSEGERAAVNRWDPARWRAAWEAADLPPAIFDAAEALAWALDRRDDVIAGALALVSLLDRREGSTWTPLEPAHFERRLGAIWSDAERDAVCAALPRPTVAGLWAPAVEAAAPDAPTVEGATPWVRVANAVTSRRSWRWERRLAGWLREARGDAAPRSGTETQTGGEAPEPSTPTDREASPTAAQQAPRLTAAQKAAVSAAGVERLTAITGGPGTGKTTVIAAVVQRLLAGGTAPEAVALAAPTGKAAQRLRESLARAGLSLEVETLHRRLGYRPDDDAFSAGPDRPLTADVVIVDEASMVDLRLMERLVSALTPTARLVLVGDAHQLPSVDAGAVFRDLVDAAPERVVRLETNLRVAESPGGRALLELADQIRVGEVRLPEAQTSLPPCEAEGVFLLRRSGEPRIDRRTWHAWIEAPDAERAKILTVVREGPHGSAAVNAETAARRAARAGAHGWAVGQPVMVTRNLYARRLFNGDLGIVDDGAGPGRRAVRFPSSEGGDRCWDLATLAGDLVGADALTVHKAQGSEFDRVLLWLPPEAHPLLSRELLYTAVTRARRQVVIAGDPSVVAQSVRRPIHRRTGSLA